MSTIYAYDDDGNMFVEFDSRWRYPHLLGFRPEDPEYAGLQAMWEEYTGQEIPECEKPESDNFSSQPVPTWDALPENVRAHHAPGTDKEEPHA